MMATRTSHCDRSYDHQFIELGDVGEFSDRWRFGIATTKHLLNIHFCDPFRSVLTVMVVVDVHNERPQDFVHFFLHFCLQFLDLTFFQKGMNVVVGMKALSSR